jgi:diacylglycerol kinase (ATP)
MTKNTPSAIPVIYSESAGSTRDSTARLEQIVTLLKAAQVEPQVTRAATLEAVAAAAGAAQQTCPPLIIICGGDGSVETVANTIIDANIPLAILPTGTRNNIARSLNIPLKLADAVHTVKTGHRTTISAGLARCEGQQRWFLETFTVGLFSALYPDADALQKGNLRKVGDLFMTFVNAPQSTITARIHDDGEQVTASAHAVLGLNLPMTAANLRLAGDVAYDDEHLDVFIYDNLDKVDLLIYGIDVVTGMGEDPAIRRLRVRRITITSDPPLPVMADGFLLGHGRVDVELAPHRLHVIGGAPVKR